MKNNKVVIYARVSSREQEREGFSIPAQLKLLREYAEKHTFEIVEEYSDAETAKKEGRTNFNRMLAYLRENPDIRTVLVEKTDRLYRNFKDYVTLEDYDLEVHLVKEGSIISKNSRSHDKFIHGIKVLMAKNYIDNLSEEIKKGLQEGLSEGYWPFQPPYGYLRGKKKIIVVDKKHAIFVKQAFEMFATGNYSIRKLVEALFQQGYYYRADREKITHTVLEGMLKNVFYVGQMSCNGLIYRGKHPAIVSRDLFDKVQAEFKKTNKSKVRKNFDFLYPGIAKCGICGYAISGERKRRGIVYYRCTHFDRTCPNNSHISEKQLTSAFRRHLRRIALDENLYGLLKISLKESFGDEEKFHKKEIARLTFEMAETKELLRKMYLDHVEMKLSDDMWMSLKNEHEMKLHKCENDLIRHNNAHVCYLDTGFSLLDVCRLANRTASELSDEDVAKIVRQVMDKVTIVDKKVKMTFIEPFSTLEKLIRVARQGIEEYGFDEFSNKALAYRRKWAEKQEKSHLGSCSSSSIFSKYWA